MRSWELEKDTAAAAASGEKARANKRSRENKITHDPGFHLFVSSITTTPPAEDVGVGVDDVVTGGGFWVGTLVGDVEGAGVGCALFCGMTNRAE